MTSVQKEWRGVNGRIEAGAVGDRRVVGIKLAKEAKGL